ncbi:MAG: site-specific DNA-methyltransferase [Caldisericia bacterium]|nr:site-specific DNA-methyltransferase [Caldisericia bacterium]
MDKLSFETDNFVKKNIEKIESLFPNVITEMKDEDGKLKKGIDFEKLKQELSEEIIEGDERYDFTWVGKKASVVEANKPIRKTLRPCIEESKNWETTENLYIEGDNLEVLKLLQESYLNSIKMIYIDPPYNTGNDFIYKDNFTIGKDEYDEQIGLYDEEENRLFQNTESNGRFHSDWCSMMYSRLKLAHSLLSEDGVIFISIDDNEVHNLRRLCDEVFGENNFVTNIIWQKKYSPQNDAKWFSDNHDFILCYAKNKDMWRPKLLPRSDKMNLRYSNPDNDPKGAWKLITLHAKSGNKSDFSYTFKNGYTWRPPSGTFARFSKETLSQYESEQKIWFGKDGNSTPAVKNYLSNVKQGVTPLTVWLYTDVGHTHEAKEDVKTCFDGISPFDTPKPVKLLKRLIHISGAADGPGLILDFFSGSSTTAHAVMQLNAEDGGNRKFIMINLPEPCSEDSEAYKVGYKNICEIGKERIRRAGEKINQEIINNNKQLKIGEEEKKPVDNGFRVFKVDSSNMKDVYYSADEYNQEMLSGLESNIKEDRTDLDLLYGIMLDWGLPLSLNHKIEKIDGIDIHIVDTNVLIACFAEKINEKVVKEIAKKQPIRAVFKDSSFASSPEKINIFEIFKLLAPTTTIKVI